MRKLDLTIITKITSSISDAAIPARRSLAMERLEMIAEFMLPKYANKTEQGLLLGLINAVRGTNGAVPIVLESTPAEPVAAVEPAPAPKAEPKKAAPAPKAEPKKAAKKATKKAKKSSKG